MSGRLSLRHLRCFVTVAETGSFTAAAGRLFQTQSSLTSTIKSLESAVGVRLFDRTTRRVELTENAIWFKVVAQKLLTDFECAIDDLKASATMSRGHIRIAASPSTMVHIVSPALVSFRKSYPKISISVQDGGSDMIERAVLNGAADFGVSSALNSFPDLDYVPLLSDPFGVIFPADHPLAKKREPISWKDLARYDFIGLSADTGIGKILSNTSSLGLSNRANHSDQASSSTALYTLLRMGGKISAVPALTAHTGALSSFRFKILHNPSIVREICLITRHQRSLAPTTQQLLTVLMSTIKDDVNLFGATPNFETKRVRKSGRKVHKRST